MSPVELGKALSSRARIQILESLSRKPMTMEELSKEISLETITTRHHVRVLTRAGLVEEYGEERRTGGRPAIRYQTTRQPKMIQWPKRQYELLSASLLRGFVDTLGRRKARSALRNVGRAVGEDMAREITERKAVAQWDTEAIKRFIIEEHLTDIGAAPEVTGHDAKKIHFRMHNCVFLELARDYPDLICESLDEGLMETLLRDTIGKARWIQMKCFAHGDRFCEHEIRLGR